MDRCDCCGMMSERLNERNESLTDGFVMASGGVQTITTVVTLLVCDWCVCVVMGKRSNDVIEHLVYYRAIGDFTSKIERYSTEGEARSRVLDLQSQGYSAVYGGARQMGDRSEWYVGLDHDFHTGF